MFKIRIDIACRSLIILYAKFSKTKENCKYVSKSCRKIIISYVSVSGGKKCYFFGKFCAGTR